MKITSRQLACLQVVALLGTLSFHVAGQDAPSQVASEIARLQRSLKDKPISEPNLKDLNSMGTDTLKAAANALAAGRLYLGLENLGQAIDLIQGGRRATDSVALVEKGLPAFDSEWGKLSVHLASLDKEAHGRDWKHVPAAVRAMAETAQGKSIPLLDGARGFATATAPKDGLFYLGQAQGEAEFAEFCATLTLSAKGSSPPLRSLLPELRALQEKTNTAFQPPRSIEQHSRFIALNSALKLAQELDASKFYAGALYTYLEAVRHYGMLDAAPLDAARQAEVKQRVAGELAKLAASGRDDSIAQLFVERAVSYTNHADGSTPSADEWRAAQVVLDQVLPAYDAAQKAAAPVLRASGKTVAITLVRWPYT